MGSYLILTSICIAGGIVFAFFAMRLSKSKGNTISDIANSSKLNDAKAIQIEILDKIKISSIYPIVGLYIVSAVVAIGLPVFIGWNMFQKPNEIKVWGNIIKETDKKVTIRPTKMRVEASGYFEIFIDNRTDSQSFNFESDYYNPFTLNISTDLLANRLNITSNLKDDEAAVSIPIINYNDVQYPEKIKPIPIRILNTVRTDQVSEALKKVEDPEGASDL